jgi:hypothetical protein
MRCPQCAEVRNQRWMNSAPGQPGYDRYRCGPCDHTYVLPHEYLFDRLSELKTRVQALAQQDARIVELIDEIEAGVASVVYRWD